METATGLDWRTEYLRRVAEAMTPEHAAHGFRAEPTWDGYDGSDSSGDGGSMSITLTGVCSCGEKVDALVWGPEEVVTFMRRLTAA
jgi:hypothetical protein